MSTSPHRLDLARITRRRFLAGAAAVAAAPAALAIDPVARPGDPLMKLSLAAYSFRRQLRAEPGTEGAMDMPGFVDYCAAQDLDGAELTSYFFPPTFERSYLNGLKRRAHLAGVDISGGAIGNNFTVDEGPDLEKQLEHTRAWIDHYADLGAPVIRVFAGRPAKGVSVDEAIRRCVPVLETACEAAAKRGVMLALENHDFTTDVARMMEIVRAVKSPWFGVNLDSGNFHSADPYKDLEEIAPYAVNAQLKVEIRRAGQGPEPADFDRVVGILRDAGYSGYVVLEYEAKEDPYEAVPRHLDRLRKLIG